MTSSTTHETPPPQDTLRALAPWLLVWGALVAWCVKGFPPSADLPAHAAQMQTLAELFRHNPLVSAYYRAEFSMGYGITSWLFLPLTLATNGATSARIATWLALFLLPLGVWALARAMGRSSWAALLSAPYAFNISYWHGFLPTFFALPFVFFAWATFVHALRKPSWLPIAATSVLGTLVLLSHFLPFGALCVGLVALAWAHGDFKRGTLRLVAALALPALSCAPRVWTLLHRSLDTQVRDHFEYRAIAHFNWLYRLYEKPGRYEIWLCWALGLFCLWAFWKRKPLRHSLASALFASQLGLYLVAPISLGGAWLVFPRLTLFVGILALLLTELSDWKQAPRLLTAWLMACLSFSLYRHAYFAHAISGLDEAVAVPTPKGLHGGYSTVGFSLPGQKLIHLEHVHQWWTATQGGLGHHFFADADHQPVRFVEGKDIPAALSPQTPEADFQAFSSLLVFGPGEPPPAMQTFEMTRQFGNWRLFENRAAPVHGCRQVECALPWAARPRELQ